MIATDVLLVGFGAAAVRVATPLLLAASGELLAERGGVINLGVEGAMLSGALAAALGGQAGGVWVGVAAALLAGAFVGGCFAALAIGVGANQIISGTAMTLASVGLTGAIFRRSLGAGGVGASVPTLHPLPVPGLADIPGLGPIFFQQPPLTYIAYVTIPLLWWILVRTRAGLSLRAAGEGAAQASAMGVPVRRIRSVAVVTGSALAGLGGAALVLGQVGSFAERMTAGRGFVAIAIVVLGRWHPLGVLAAGLVFGAATALQFVFQATGIGVPYQWLLMLPYLLALLALAGTVGGIQSPAELGRDPDDRR